MRTSESSQNSTARVNLVLDQCLQNKASETVLIYCKINVLLQCYSDASLSEKRINNLIYCNLIHMLCFFKSFADIFFKYSFQQRLG